ncbi:MAG: metal ABC transporter substrate-binding protein [Lachnospiraceae bacterium]|nr:metal ABC transporter substrate-binding protein [Lachnospiraceae bacterium]
MKMDNHKDAIKYRWVRSISILIIMILSVGCAADREDTIAEDGKIRILCTAFPLYDWTRQITEGCEDSIGASLLMDQGTDPHNYQPTAEDIIRISEADIIVYVGGESDLWMEDVLASIPEERRERQQYLSMMEILGSSLREEEHIEGMQENFGGHAYGEVDAGEEGHTGGAEYDEHIWLSLRNASTCVQAIEAAVMDKDLDQNDSQIVAENTERYLVELESLDGQYGTMVSEASLNRVLFADRFPFLYLMKDYGLEYDAAFPGCSTETEASFETVIFLAGRLEEFGLPAVLVMEDGDRRIAETIIANTADKDQEILALNSMQSVTAADIGQGVTYLSVMQENLAVLRTALAYE